VNKRESSASEALVAQLERLYQNRFSGMEAQRNAVWRILTRYYFQRWVKATDVVLDVGAGYCEFINNIAAAKKYALDLNPVTAAKASPEVTVYSQDVTKPWGITSESVDFAFSSNFFEHLPSKQDLSHALKEIHRVLRKGGLLCVMGPNIRFCPDIYWDRFDHHLALSDRSMLEALETLGFTKAKVIPKFLPATMKGSLSPKPLLVRLYSMLPLAWRILGKQYCSETPQSFCGRA
jgi:SAM-dependent methyltransferase